MPLTNDDMRLFKEDLRGTLTAAGKTGDEANEIVAIAAQAAREAMSRLIEVIGAAPDSHRDAAIVLALNIMERLALAGHQAEKLNPYTS